MNPLGPLNGKSFGTIISPWIITLDALEPFKSAAPERNSEVTLAPYLQDPSPSSSYNVSITATIESQASPNNVVCRTNLKTLYWTLRDMVAHQTSNGCNLTTGDLLATGTISGTTAESHGCLLELVKSGGAPVKTVGGGETTKFWLEDGDTVRMIGLAGPGVGFGECVGMVLPSN
jgi:fumarylacetoacetase